MTQDKRQAEILNDAALEEAVGGGKQAVSGLMAPTSDDPEVVAAPPGTPWSSPLRKLKKTIK